MSKKAQTSEQMDIAWKHCKSIYPNNKKKLKCDYCGKEMHGGVTRLKEHLAGIAGQVAACTEVPSTVKKEIIEHLRQKKKEKQTNLRIKERLEDELMGSPAQNNSDSDNDDEDDEIRDMRRATRESQREHELELKRRKDVHQGIGTSAGGGSEARLGARSRSLHVTTDRGLDDFLQPKRSSKQPKIKAALKGLKDLKNKVGRAVSQFLIYNHIPFNVANSPHYHGMVREIAAAGPGIKPPTSYEISNTYLDMEVEDYRAYLKTFHHIWDEYGCTIMCDGWTTQNRRSIINFLVYSSAGTIFLKSVDASDQYKDGKYICKLMREVVDEIGEHRVIQIVTDNGPNYKAGGKLLMQEKQHLYWTPCAAHCIDLMLKDMAEDDEVHPIISKSQKLTSFIYNHSWALSIMRRETNNGELIRPAITRFATNFLALNSILAHQNDLKRMVVAKDWAENYLRLRNRERTMADEAYEMIYDDSYWTDVAFVASIFSPLVKVLRMVDSDDKAEMGYLYEAMDRAKEGIRNNVGQGYRKWWKMVDKRWEAQLHRDIHAAGYFLNPHYQYSKKARNDNEVITGFRHVVDRVEQDMLVRIQIKKEAEQWRMKQGVFGYNDSKTALQHSLPAQWWNIVALEECPNLTRFAVRILSQTVSSSNCERNWTTFSLIHTRPRNKITMERLNKLVFVHYNMRLRARMSKRKEAEKEIINLDEIFHEDDPLVEWTREQEDCLLDDRDNTWLDEALEGDEALAATDSQAERIREENEELDNESNDDDDGSHDNNSGDDDDGGNNQSISRGLDAIRSDQRSSYDNVRSREPMHHGRRIDNIYKRRARGHNETTPSDSGGYDTSYNSYSQCEYQGYPPIGQSIQPSSFDNMIGSFFGSTHIDHHLPHEPLYGDYIEQDVGIHRQQQQQGPYYFPHQAFNYQRHDDEYDDDYNNLEPHRASSAWMNRRRIPGWVIDRAGYYMIDRLNELWRLDLTTYPLPLWASYQQALIESFVQDYFHNRHPEGISLGPYSRPPPQQFLTILEDSDGQYLHQWVYLKQMAFWLLGPLNIQYNEDQGLVFKFGLTRRHNEASKPVISYVSGREDIILRPEALAPQNTTQYLYLEFSIHPYPSDPRNAI